ncbi:MAG: hypothetical protein Q4E05_11495 [Pseudoclavibacter sp.]|nr:hypothetical protein [Pseudoclavibacter sp.]
MWQDSQITADMVTTDDSYRRDETRPVEYGIDMSYDRIFVSIAVAFWDRAGRRHVEVAARRAGIDWVVPWLTSPERRHRPHRIALQFVGAPISSFGTELEQAGIELVPWQGPDLGRATGAFYDGVRSGQLRHTGPQPALDAAAATAQTKPAGDSWLIDRKRSVQDAAPLVACIAADWLLTAQVEQDSYYESHELVIV